MVSNYSSTKPNLYAYTGTGETPICTFSSVTINFTVPKNIKDERTISDQAKAKKISVPKLIKTNIRNHLGYKERKEFWR